MAVNGNIKTDVIVMDDTYDVSVAIPTSKPSVENPYLLTIYNEAEVAKTPPTDDTPMLAWVAASYDDASTSAFPDNFYLELSPPASILPSVAGAAPVKQAFAIKSISIQFATGKYIAGSTGAVAVPGAVKGTKA